jgi:hypothetical protein
VRKGLASALKKALEDHEAHLRELSAAEELAKAELEKKAPPGFSEARMHELKAQYPGEPEKAFAAAWKIHKDSMKKNAAMGYGVQSTPTGPAATPMAMAEDDKHAKIKARAALDGDGFRRRMAGSSPAHVTVHPSNHVINNHYSMSRDHGHLGDHHDDETRRVYAEHFRMAAAGSKVSKSEDDDLAAGPSCPTCSGPGMLLGNLGSKEHFRCRNCGMGWSHTSPPDDVVSKLMEREPTVLHPSDRGPKKMAKAWRAAGPRPKTGSLAADPAPATEFDKEPRKELGTTKIPPEVKKPTAKAEGKPDPDMTHLVTAMNTKRPKLPGMTAPKGSIAHVNQELGNFRSIASSPTKMPHGGHLARKELGDRVLGKFERCSVCRKAEHSGAC